MTLHTQGSSRARDFMVGLLGFLSLATTTTAQWGQNPLIEGYDDAPFVFGPIGASPAAIQMVAGGPHNIQFEVRHLNHMGHNTPPPFFWSEDDIDADVGFVGCSLGDDAFALAYQLNLGGTSVIRVVIMRYAFGAYSVDPGFPVSVGSGWGLAITPNLNAGSIDGVWLAWNFNTGLGPHTPVQVRQQGIRGDGSFAFTGGNAINGAIVWAGNFLDDGVIDTPSISSDGLGLAIVTHREWEAQPFLDWGNGRIHWTTKLDNVAGVPAVLWSHAVPGQLSQVSYSPGVCLVARDGTGGAFYGYTRNEGTAQTDLMIARVDSTGAIADGHPFWSDTNPLHADLLRPLAILPTPDNAVVLTYRDHQLCAALKFGSGPNIPLLWEEFLTGATSDNSDAADSAMGIGACSGSLAIVWTRHSAVASQKLDLVTGEPQWDGNSSTMIKEPHLINAWQGGGNAPRRPQIFATGMPTSRFVFGWYDEFIHVPIEIGVFADRRTCGGFIGLMRPTNQLFTPPFHLGFSLAFP